MRRNILNIPILYRSKQWLSKKYLQEMMSSQAIANIVGCDRKTIDQWLRKIDIKKRGFGGSRGIKSKEWLIEEYVNKNKSLHDLAIELKEDRKTIHRWLIKYGISRHPIGDNRKGKDSPLWNGGKYDYKINPNGYKEYQTKRMNGFLVKEHREIVRKYLKRKLKRTEHIHHINFNRTDNRIENLYLFSTNSEHQKYHHLYRKVKIGLLKSNLIKEN